VTFLRLNRWDWIAFAAALALLLVMSLDWYSTRQGEECRRIESVQTPSPRGGDLIGRDVRRSARECAEKREKNAWQASGAIDRFIAIVLVAGIAAAGANAFMRASGREFDSRRAPSAVAAGLGLLAALLVLYRILQPPGLNDAAVVKVGAPIGLVLVGLMAIASRSATVAERRPLEEEVDTEERDAEQPAAEADSEESQDTPPSGYEPPPEAPAEPAPSG
jgi:drug/metabolite transporter (DMT)-like permease